MSAVVPKGLLPNPRRAHRALRRMESECRNRLARPAKKEQLEQAGGMSLDDALARLFALHGSISPGLYDRINSAILQMM